MIGCCNQTKLLKNGLTKKATTITDYTIKIEKDSLNNSIKDTIIITEKLYNENDQIISRLQRNLFVNESMEIGFIYDKSKKLIKETVKLSSDSSAFSVNYFYKDSLLQNHKSETSNDIFRFTQIGEYKYNSKNKLKEGSLRQLYIDLETNDTITNTIEIAKYNKKENVYETIINDYIKPERNKKTKSDYDCETLIRTREYDYKDSLISTTEYNYKFDEFENWIERQSFENGKLNYIRTREIEYK